MVTMKSFDAMLRYDAVSEAMRASGKDMNDPGAFALAVLLRKENDEMLRGELLVREDTYPEMIFDDAQATLEDLGFRLIHARYFARNGFRETALLYWLPGLLVCAETFETDRLGSINLYFNIRVEDASAEEYLGSGKYVKDQVFSGLLNCTVALKHKFEKLLSVGEPLEQWEEPPAFLDHWIDRASGSIRPDVRTAMAL